MNTVTKHKPAPSHVTQPMSVASLAKAVGVDRQRLYTLLRRGNIKATPMIGGYVIMPDEANRVIDAATRIMTVTGDRVLFDLEEDRV